MLQEGGVYPSARVRETIELYAALYGNVADPDQLMHICGLSERSKSTWRQLSGGERQRLSLALALTARPEVAFLDEPTSGVDITGRGLMTATAWIWREAASGVCGSILLRYARIPPAMAASRRSFTLTRANAAAALSSSTATGSITPRSNLSRSSSTATGTASAGGGGGWLASVAKARPESPLAALLARSRRSHLYAGPTAKR